MVFTTAYFKLGQVRDGVGTTGAGFDVLCAGVGCGLGDRPYRVWGHLPESQAATGAGSGGQEGWSWSRDTHAGWATGHLP